MTTPTLSILVSCISTPESSAATLASLTHVPSDITCEAFLIAAKEEAAPLAALLGEAAGKLPVTPGLLTIDAPYGRAKAFNTAASQAASDYILFLEAGAQLTESSITPLDCER